MIKEIFIGMLIMYVITGIYVIIDLCVNEDSDFSNIFFWSYCWWINLIIIFLMSLKSVFTPFYYYKISIFLIKKGFNPWKTKIDTIATLPNEQFQEWLNLLNDEEQNKWKRIRKNFEKDLIKEK